MIDFGFDKLALIGAVALIVIGPQKLPKVARTVGHLFGKAQRYVADVKAEVNRSIELDELKKMKTDFEDAARGMQSEVQAAAGSLQSSWSEASATLNAADPMTLGEPLTPLAPVYTRPNKKWRLKRGSVPQWYKHRHGVRAKAQSGAARVARFRPPRSIA